MFKGEKSRDRRCKMLEQQMEVLDGMTHNKEGESWPGEYPQANDST